MRITPEGKRALDSLFGPRDIGGLDKTQRRAKVNEKALETTVTVEGMDPNDRDLAKCLPRSVSPS
jgi:hypothetical protein